MEPTPTVGRIIHYVMTEYEARGRTRPAIVVAVVDQEAQTLNLQVFSDGENDGGNCRANILWRTSVQHDAAGAPGTWRWPDELAAAPAPAAPPTP